MASEGLHEPIEKLKPETVDIHRAIVSLMEELEAIDWYRQRVDASADPQLGAVLEHNMNEEIEHASMSVTVVPRSAHDVLAHNMNEEIEHASMVLEWIRRHVPKFNEALRTYLFTTIDITEIEEKVESGGEEGEGGNGSKRATIGDMKGN